MLAYRPTYPKYPSIITECSKMKIREKTKKDVRACMAHIN